MKEITEGEEFIYIDRKGRRFRGKISGRFKSLRITKLK